MIKIETKVLPDNRIQVTNIENALGYGELPKEYHEHVPYILWQWNTKEDRDKGEKNRDTGFLLINYIGGIEHVYIGSKYTQEEWAKIIGYIEGCERKLNRVKRPADTTNLLSLPGVDQREQEKLSELFNNLSKDLKDFYSYPQTADYVISRSYEMYSRIMNKHIPIIRNVIRGWHSDDVYHHRDIRTKCRKCGRWMRFHPTPKTPAKRSEAPNAGTCTDCLAMLGGR